MTDICGVETTKGEPCQNPAESCPWHNVDEKPDTGRDTKLSLERQEQIATAIEQGKSLTSAARMAGVDRTTVYGWIDRGEADAESGEENVFTEFYQMIKQTDWWEKKDKFDRGDSRIEVECHMCDSKKLVYPSRAEKFDKHYCKQHHPTATGEDSPNWKKNTTNYRGPNWTEQREKALNRDNHSCQSCGMHNKQHIDKWDQSLHVHHIIARSEFDDTDPAQNDLTNLVTLCRSCHGVYEGCNLSPVHRGKV